MKISVKSKVRLNGLGWLGAAFFIVPPAFAALIYSRMVGNIGSFSSSTITDQMIQIVVCGLLSLVGFVMLLVGREYDHKIEIDRGENQ